MLEYLIEMLRPQALEIVHGWHELVPHVNFLFAQPVNSASDDTRGDKYTAWHALTKKAQRLTVHLPAVVQIYHLLIFLRVQLVNIWMVMWGGEIAHLSITQELLNFGDLAPSNTTQRAKQSGPDE